MVLETVGVLLTEYWHGHEPSCLEKSGSNEIHWKVTNLKCIHDAVGTAAEKVINF